MSKINLFYCYFCQRHCCKKDMIGALCQNCYNDYLNEVGINKNTPRINKLNELSKYKKEQLLQWKEVNDCCWNKRKADKNIIRPTTKEKYIKYLKKYHNDEYLKNVIEAIKRTPNDLFGRWE